MDSTPHGLKPLTSVFGWEPVHYGWYGVESEDVCCSREQVWSYGLVVVMVRPSANYTSGGTLSHTQTMIHKLHSSFWWLFDLAWGSFCKNVGGGVAHSVERSVRNRQAQGSKPCSSIFEPGDKITTNLSNFSNKEARMAQWIRRRQEIPGSSPGMGLFFLFVRDLHQTFFVMCKSVK